MRSSTTNLRNIMGHDVGHQMTNNIMRRWLGTPRLVRETSIRRLFGRGGRLEPKSSEDVRRDFSDVVMPPALQRTVRSLAASTANTKRHGAAFRHMLFYGPPGGLQPCSYTISDYEHQFRIMSCMPLSWP